MGNAASDRVCFSLNTEQPIDNSLDKNVSDLNIENNVINQTNDTSDVHDLYHNVFKLYDEDQDHKITKDEFINFYMDLQAIGVFGTDSHKEDYHISKAEKIFEHVDHHNDGKLKFEKFWKYSNKHNKRWSLNPLDETNVEDIKKKLIEFKRPVDNDGKFLSYKRHHHHRHHSKKHSSSSKSLAENSERVCLPDFDMLNVIGRGAFGEVRLVRKKDTGTVYAMKIMMKSQMVNENHVRHVITERDVMAKADTPWLVKMFYSWQDPENLYMVMEYMPGGDLMSMLMKYDIFNEKQTAFYIAEMALAIDSFHKLGYIHRDLKPDNVLFDARGHCKLTDFGLAVAMQAEVVIPKSMRRSSLAGNTSFQQLSNKRQYKQLRKENRNLIFSTVGTPDYIAPEVFAKTGYGNECDWWSLGVIMFECLCGYPAFFSDDPNMVHTQIVNWKKYLKFPKEIRISKAAKDCIKKLICDSKDRMKLPQLKKHEFFRHIDWDNIRSLEAPIIPDLASDTDTHYFDNLAPQLKIHTPDTKGKLSKKRPDKARGLFKGFTHRRIEMPLQTLNALKSNMNNKSKFKT